MWILRTWQELRAAGVACTLGGELPRAGVVVFHAKHRRQVRAGWTRLRRVVLVGVRADSSPPRLADYEVLQSGLHADGRRRFFVPHWRQPGLVPRDPRRGERLQRLIYKGYLRNLAPELQLRSFASALAGRGVEWVIDAVEYAGGATPAAMLRWHDYSDVDGVLALRPRRRGESADKPASKLTNAWAAGVPALLGPEYAFRELRRSELDYLEVRDAAAALAAVDRLINEAGLYRAMIENGLVRAHAFDDAAVLARWREVLEQEIPRRAATGWNRRLGLLPLPLRALLRRVADGFDRRRR